MYVCICNAITEKQANEAVKMGYKKPLDIINLCGNGVHCGKCCTQMREIINDKPQQD